MKRVRAVVAAAALIGLVSGCSSNSSTGGSTTTTTAPAPSASSSAMASPDEDKASGTPTNTLAATPALPANPAAQTPGPAVDPAQVADNDKPHGGGLLEADARKEGMGDTGEDTHPVLTVVAGPNYCIPSAGTVPHGEVWVRLWNVSGAPAGLVVGETAAAGAKKIQVKDVPNGQGGALLVAVLPGTLLLDCQVGGHSYHAEVPVSA